MTLVKQHLKTFVQTITIYTSICISVYGSPIPKISSELKMFYQSYVYTRYNIIDAEILLVLIFQGKIIG